MLLALLVAVLVPSACVLWFMNAAMRNERLAVRQRLTDVYRQQLLDVHERLEKFWRSRQAAMEQAAGFAPPLAFEQFVALGMADAVLIYNPSGRLAYPTQAAAAVSRAEGLEGAPAIATSAASGPEDDLAKASVAQSSASRPATAVGGGEESASADVPMMWPDAEALEQTGRFAEAAIVYAGLAATAVGVDAQAHALQAQARCLVRAGRPDMAMPILAGKLAEEEFASARDPTGRLIAPQALTFALELTDAADAAARDRIAEELSDRLADYAGPAMPSSQRLFLMLRLREAAGIACPTLAAEQLAAEALEAGPGPPAGDGPRKLERLPVWSLRGAGGQVVALLREDTLSKLLEAMGPNPARLAGARAVFEPSPRPSGPDEPLAWITLEPSMPDWHLAAYLDDPALFASAAARRRAAYLYTGTAGVLAIVALSSAVAAYLGRQIRLTRLKNDFIATVSHELKTPLASMRVLVDTLRQGRCRSQAQAGEYFELIARENERLSRLIDNFLSFSRMERNRRAFDFAPTDLSDVARVAAEAVRDRFATPAVLEVELAERLPAVRADHDALVTVVMNLLDNAWKYSAPPQWARLRTGATDDHVWVEVSDRGIGLSRRSIRRLFQRFYQVDQTLSRRAGGCGLGLAIVKFILDAHGGTIDVRSQPGKGSTFTVSLPVDAGADAAARL